jgi:exopolysaccharide production protein ExoQ
MPPHLASLVFVAFIFWLFRRHAKEAGGVSHALWIPLLWVGIKASRPAVYWLATGNAAAGAADATQGDAVDRNMDLLFIAVGIMVLANRRIDWPNVGVECRWLIIFYAYLLLSTLWAYYTFISFKRWGRDIGDVVMILVILTEANPVEAFRWVFLRCAYVLIPVSVLFIKYYPDLGRYYSKWTWTTCYCGIAGGKNQLGALAMWGGLVLLWQVVDVDPSRGHKLTWRNRRYFWPDLLVLGMCLWLLHLANSSTSMGSFVVGVMVFFGSRLQWIKAKLKSPGLCLAGAAAAMIAMTVVPDFRGAVAGSLDRNADLTNRTEIWDWALGLNTDPLIGSGFAGTLLVPWIAKEAEEIGVPHVHDGYLQTYVDTGMIGVCLLLVVLYMAAKNATRQLSENTIVGPLFMALFFSGLFYNYTEVAFNKSCTVGFLLWLMAAYGVVQTMPAHQAGLSSEPTDYEPEANRI